MGLINSIFGSGGIEERVKELKQVCKKFAYNQERLKTLAINLYKRRKEYVDALVYLSQRLSTVDNLPSWVYSDFEESLEQIKDFRKAIEYENSPKKFAEITDETGRTAKIIGSAANTETAFSKLDSKAAMSIATVIGTVSTGTAISALSGIAATNAALAWLGGGVIAAGGTGIAGGSLILGLFGPIGWTIAGLGTVGGIMTARRKNKDKLKEVESQIDTIKRDNQNMEPKLVHLSELITRSCNNYQSRLLVSINWLNSVQPKDYNKWDDTQKHELEKLINAVAYTVQLINERV